MAQSDAQSTQIDGFTYTVGMLDPMVSTDLLADLGFVLAPALGALGGLFAQEKGDAVGKLLDGVEEKDTSKIGESVEKAVVGLFARFDKQKQRELIDILAKVTTVTIGDKNPQLSHIFSSHFRGRIKSLYLWLGFALKTQYQDFFSGMDGDFSQLVQKMAQATSSSPTT